MLPQPRVAARNALFLFLVALTAGCASGTGSVKPSRGDSMSAASEAANSLTLGVQRRTLDNGLTVLVKENPAAPVVAVVTWVKTGYFHEPDELAGISHVVEHMYFNGTPDRPDPEDISRETKGYGGTLNAGTIYDHTSFYVVLPGERWREALSVQADAFQNPLFDQSVLAKEMEAILQEARRKLDNPSAYGMEKMFELAFEKHRMRRWRIGTEEVLRGIDREALVKWYEDHYRPQNTILSVVGDVDAEEVFAEIERLYGDQPRGHLRKRGGPTEPAQEAFRYRRLRGELARNYVFAGFHLPPEGHEDTAALDVLATVLGTGRSSRLVSRLKEDLGVVTSIGSSVFHYEDVGMLLVNAICGVEDLDRASREIFVEIERMKLFGPTEDELDRARAILETAEASAQEEVLGQAGLLAHYQSRGDFELYDEEVAALRAVTAADVQRVAREYLELQNATLLEYVPVQIYQDRDPREMAEHVRAAVLAAVATMEEPGPSEPGPSFLPRTELDQWAARLAEAAPGEPGRHRFELPGGGVLLVEERRDTPTVSVGMWFRGGRIGEFDNVSGMTRLLQRVMEKETFNRNAKQLAKEIESLGTAIGRISTDDSFGFTVGGLARNLPYVFDVLFDAITNSRLTREQLTREVEAHLSAIAGVHDQSSALALQLARRAIFPGHPYGLPELGLGPVVQYLTLSRLEEHHAEVVRPEAMVLSVVGDVDAALVHEMVRRYTDDWKVGGRPVPAAPEEFYSKERYATVPELLSVREETVAKDRSQSALILGWQTIPRTHPDTAALDVLQAITGGMGGTFFERIRTERGLAYQVATLNVSNAMGGWFGTFVACSPDSADVVRGLVLDLHRDLTEEPPAADLLERAQSYVAGSWAVGLQTNRARAGLLASLEVAGLPLERLEGYPDLVRSVTRDDLLRVAREYFRDEPYGVGMVEGRSGRGASPQ